MDNEKMNELAQKYAEYRAEPFDDAHNEIALEYFKDTTAFLRWLSKTHCIVEKKSVAEWVNDIEFFMPDKRSVTMLKIGAKSLFGKELFNKTKNDNKTI